MSNTSQTNTNAVSVPSTMTYSSEFTIGEGDGFAPHSGGGSTPTPLSGTFDNNTENPSNTTTFYEKLLFCFSSKTYQQYFNVDTIDIYDRMMAVFTTFAVVGGFQSVLEQNGSGADLYGPFWISTTLVFFVAVSSNLSMYLHSDSSSDFEYDVNHVGRAMGVIYSFVFTLSFILYFSFQCLSIRVALVEIICIYGYSMVPFLPAALLCAIPFNIWIWMVLSIAGTISLNLVLKNLVGSMMKRDDTDSSNTFWGKKKDGPILGTLIGCHFILLLVLKMRFYHHAAKAPTTSDPV